MRHNTFPLFFLLILLTHGVRADVLTMKQGGTFEAHVEALVVSAGNHLFVVRNTTNGIVDAESHPVLAADIESIEFRATGGTSSAARGRLAEGVLADGRDFSEVPFERAMSENGSLVFYARHPGTAPGADVHPLPIAEVTRLKFARLDSANTPAPTPTPVQAPVDADELQGPEPEFSMFVPDLTILDSEGEYEGERYSDADLDVNWTGSGTNSAAPKQQKSEGFRQSVPAFLNSSYMLPFAGLAVDLLSFLIFILLGTVTGGIFLYMSGRVEGVDDFPAWKAFAAAAAISVFSPLAFRLAAFIPIFGFVAGLFAFYFTTRAIVMGAMEVLEEKANSVLFTYMLIEIGTLVLIVVVLDKMSG